MSTEQHYLQQSIELSLKELDNFLKTSSWQGRENEVVNLFAHTFLAKHIDVSQIGMEVAVKQLNSQGKDLVRKDLVIRGIANQTVRNNEGIPVNDPIAVLERKINDITKCYDDIEWLKKFTKLYPKVIGYSICACIKENRGVSYTIIK